MSIGTIGSILSKIEENFINVVNEDLSSKVKNPDYVYHYTTIKSFMEIIESNEIWLSHASYLNDPLEINFGIDVIINNLEGKEKEYSCVLPILEKQRKIYKESSLDLNRDLVFFFSFSEYSDKLSSWIQYGDDGNGICLEFIYSYLLSKVSSHVNNMKDKFLFPIQYYSNDYFPNVNNVNGFDDAMFKYYKEMDNLITSKGMEKEPNVQRTLYEKTKSFACFIKNDFHADEKEWRYIIFSGVGDDKIKIVPSNQGVKMFYRVSFEEERLIDIIDRIRIGPKHNYDPKTSEALKIFLYQKEKIMFNMDFSEGILRK